MRAAILALLMAATPCAAQTRPCDAEAAALVDAVGSAIARYADSDAARLDGFRPISFDFPGMGQHWINLRHAAVDRFDPTRPPILLYAERDGDAVLVGAAFIALRDPGEPVPGPVALRDAWHEHAGTLEEELLAADHHSHTDDDSFAVLVLHVWAAPPLDGGWFDVQNWRLPWIRSGVEPATVSSDAARALSLLHSRDYYADYLLRSGVPAADRTALDGMLRDGVDRVAALIAAEPGATSDADLEAEWRAFTGGIAALWPDARAALDRLAFDPRVRLACEA